METFRVKEVIQLDSVDSTNNYAANLLRMSKPPEGTVIMAREQTAGRGQRSTVWESNAGENLLCSIILYPEFLKHDTTFSLSKIISLSLAEVVEELSEREVFIKWPNDIIVANKKIGGILIEFSWSENKIQHAIIGIGLNLNQVNFKTEYAVSLGRLTSRTWSAVEVLEKIMKRLKVNYENLRSGQVAQIDSDYRNKLYRLGRMSKFMYGGKEILAMITGVDSSGKLKVITENSEGLTCDLKEIAMVW